MPRKRKLQTFVPNGSTTHKTTSTAKGLLSLPAELRNEILQMVCSDELTTYQHRKYRSRKTVPDKPIEEYRSQSYYSGRPQPPGILLSCKQIYSEAIQVFYANATFEFHTLYSLRRWVKRISERNLKIVRNVYLSFLGRPIMVLPETLQEEKETPGTLAAWGTVSAHHFNESARRRWGRLAYSTAYSTYCVQ